MHHIAQTQRDVITFEGAIGGVAVIAENLIVGNIYVPIRILREVTLLNGRLAGITVQLFLKIAATLPADTLGSIDRIVLALPLTIRIIVLRDLSTLRRNPLRVF